MLRDWQVDAMRGLAAILVLVSHADAYRILPIPWTQELKVTIGEAGVDLFFLISGYLIWTTATRVLPTPDGVAKYAVHRMTRIMPLYYVSLAVAVLLAPYFLGSWKPQPTAEALVRHLVFSQSLVPQVSREINPVLWTLTHEAIFYLLVPLLWVMRASIWILVPLTMALAVAAHQTGFGAIAPFLQVFFMFATGITVAQYQHKFDWKAVLAAIIVCFALWGRSWHLTSPVLALALFASLAALPEIRLARQVLRPLCIVGLVSYSLYIWHYLYVEFYGPQVIHNLAWLYRQPLFYSITFFTTLMAICALSYHMIEKPGMGALRKALLRLATRRKGESVAATMT